MHFERKITLLLLVSTIFAFNSPLFAQRIEVFFSQSVDTALCDELGVENLPDGWNVRLDSLLATYIDSAESSVDICVYRWSEEMSSFLMPAIRSAIDRSVKFRVVLDDDSVNNPISDSLDMLGINHINDLFGIAHSSIMHCKFFIIDSRDSDTTNDIAIVSSSNITHDNILDDANNTVVAYWSPLARELTKQFNIYWGSEGDTANPASSNFGDDFPNIIDHIIPGEDMTFELYFSPQIDSYEDSILNRIVSANYEAYFCINAFSRSPDIDDSFRVMFEEYDIDLRGVFGGLQANQNWSVYKDMNGLSDTAYNWDTCPLVYIDNIEGGGDLHSKYLIGDIHHQFSDPFVLTGSMNWSNNGFQNNNECVLIIHSYEVAQKFFCEFATRYTEAGGSLAKISEISSRLKKTPLKIFPNPTQRYFFTVPSLPVEIFDIEGRFLGTYFPPVDISRFPVGKYIVKSQNGTNTVMSIR